jgi:light-harvesting complex 1 beta chain
VIHPTTKGIDMAHSMNASRQGAHEDIRNYWLIFAAAFALFMAIALAGQLLGWQWRAWLPGAEGVKSLNGGVKAAVYTFMSHLS